MAIEKLIEVIIGLFLAAIGAKLAFTRSEIERQLIGILAFLFGIVIIIIGLRDYLS